MEEFRGTVRLAGDSVSLPAVLLVADNRLKVSAHQLEIGDWQLSDISARLLDDGCHVAVEGEELVVAVPEPRRFAEAIGPSIANPGDGSLIELGRHTDRLRGWARRRTRLRAPAAYLAAGAVLCAGALLAPIIIVALMLAASLAALIVGGVALMDPFTAVRIPDVLTPGRLIRGGSVGVLVALALAVLM